MALRTSETSARGPAPLGLRVELFWDVNPQAVDLEKQAGWLIRRVVERGGLEDWRRIRAHYGDAKMIEAVTTARALSPRSVTLCCAAFDLTKEDFRCCTSKPFPAAPWIY